MDMKAILTSPLRAVQRWSGQLADSLDEVHTPTLGDPKSGGRGSKRARRRERCSQEQRASTLLRALHSRRAAVRIKAATQIGKLGIWQATTVIARMAEDRRREVRRAALGALWRLDPELFVDVAMKMSRGHPREALLADLDAIVQEDVGTRGGYVPGSMGGP